ncbi:DUF3429 domain-containing protein [Salinarimonas ramus]|uniref:DUF3429 domain-containing protein n=1 Tax=Salinarimonas ramus TaxID=690164 RepID=A0A917QA34_9HYPH|nr:DUF3429 domain-containing protein [Salinarimonas ramus]GGK38817.1 hypothetical protein GCM10011322_27370 [Salinarimonas ramus]
MKADASIPPVPLVLGAAGLIPFYVPAVALLAGADLGWGADALGLALAAYGALILSFLGGIRWGIAVAMEEQDAARREYVISVVPSLLAFAALALPGEARLWTLCGLHVALGLLDYGLVCREEAPEWFGRLRLALAGAAALALALGAIGL